MVNKVSVTVLSTHLCPPAWMAKVKGSSSSAAHTHTHTLLALALLACSDQQEPQPLLVLNDCSVRVFARATPARRVTCCHLLYSPLQQAAAARVAGSRRTPGRAPQPPANMLTRD